MCMHTISMNVIGTVLTKVLYEISQQYYYTNAFSVDTGLYSK